MADRPTVLFVLFEGLADTVIDSQVLGHARAMSEAGVARFEIWTPAWSAEMRAKAQAKRAEAERKSGAPIRILRAVRPALPGSERLNAMILSRALRRFRPEFQIVHARTDYSAAVAARLKKRFEFSLVWDCRGDSVAEFLARHDGASPMRSFMASARARALEATRARAAAGCDRAIFVSHPLRELCSPLMRGQMSIVAPCAASETQFFFDASLRARMRRDLGYAEDEQVFVYSGSLANYQCFPESIALFRKAHRANPKTRLLALCPDVAAAQKAIGKLDPAVARVLRVPHESVNDYLNAADVALMLRRHGPVNKVASPTKFAEFCLTGLQVVLTDAVHDSYSHAKALGNLASPDDLGGMRGTVSVEQRQAIAEAARSRLGKSALTPLYRELYRFAEKKE